MKTLLFFPLALTLTAQTLTFDVASIKPNRSDNTRSSMRGSEGRITMENVSLRKAILAAYGIPDDREYMLAGPDWLGSERFDIQATFPPATGQEQMRQMMQTLLRDRFKLALHRETKQLPMYALVVAKGGPKIHAVEDGQGRTSSRVGQLEASKITMQKLADLLARMTGQPVIDSTGLTGAFDFKLEWSPDETQKLLPQGERRQRPDPGRRSFRHCKISLG